MEIIGIGLWIVGIIAVLVLTFFIISEGFDFEAIMTLGIGGAIATLCFYGATHLTKILLFDNESTNFIVACVLGFISPIIVYHIVKIPKRRRDAEKKQQERDKVAKENFEKETYEKQLQQSITAIENSVKYRAFTDFVDMNLNYIYCIDGYMVCFCRTEPLFVEDYARQSWRLNQTLRTVGKTQTFFDIEPGERAWTRVEHVAICQLINKYLQSKGVFKANGVEYHRIMPITNVVGKNPY